MGDPGCFVREKCVNQDGLRLFRIAGEDLRVLVIRFRPRKVLKGFEVPVCVAVDEGEHGQSAPGVWHDHHSGDRDVVPRDVRREHAGEPRPGARHDAGVRGVVAERGLVPEGDQLRGRHPCGGGICGKCVGEDEEKSEHQSSVGRFRYLEVV